MSVVMSCRMGVGISFLVSYFYWPTDHVNYSFSSIQTDHILKIQQTIKILEGKLSFFKVRITHYRGQGQKGKKTSVYT